MILTVTPNTTLDQNLFVPAFALNQTIRVSQSVISMGGKPTDVSYILGELEIPSVALGFAAGAFGKQVEYMLQARGVTTNFIQVDGMTRLNTVIVLENSGEQATFTTSTLDIKPTHIDELRKRFLMALDKATCVVTGGTLPRGVEPSLYVEFMQQARDRNIPVIFDASHPVLRNSIAGKPDYIKPNRHELEDFVGHSLNSLEEIYDAAHEIVTTFGSSTIVTLDKDGALAVLPDRAYRIPALELNMQSPAGAGDGVLAGLTAALSRGQTVEEGLRLGFAAASAICLKLGTADCDRADVERLLPEIELIPYARSN